MAQTAAPRPAPIVKWRNMESTIHGKQKNPEKTPQQPPPVPLSGTEHIEPLPAIATSHPDSDTKIPGFECLSQSPPDLTGIENQVFTAGQQINLRSTSLLDVLSETGSTQAAARKTVSAPSVMSQ